MDTYIIHITRYVAYGMVLKQPQRKICHIPAVSKEAAIKIALDNNEGFSLAPLPITIEKPTIDIQVVECVPDWPARNCCD